MNKKNFKHKIVLKHIKKENIVFKKIKTIRSREKSKIEWVWGQRRVPKPPPKKKHNNNIKRRCARHYFHIFTIKEKQ